MDILSFFSSITLLEPRLLTVNLRTPRTCAFVSVYCFVCLAGAGLFIKLAISSILERVVFHTRSNLLIDLTVVSIGNREFFFFFANMHHISTFKAWVARWCSG